jgi:superfamily II DNA/RNA helicase
MVAALQANNLELDKFVASFQTIPDAHTKNSVRHVILDEADRMLDTEFLAQVQEVVAACTHPNIQKAVFSATLPANAESIAMGMLRDPIRVVVGLKYGLAIYNLQCTQRLALETRLCRS